MWEGRKTRMNEDKEGSTSEKGWPHVTESKRKEKRRKGEGWWGWGKMEHYIGKGKSRKK